jgi:phage tail-like protein
MPLDDANSINDDLLVGSNFGLEVDGLSFTFFMGVEGLGSETATIEQRVVTPDGKDVLLKVPGSLKWDDITLKRGLNTNMDLYSWRQQVVDGDVKSARRNGSIIMYDRQGNQAARWDFEKGWPTSLKSGGLDASSDDIITEELTIAHEGITRTA